jgi:succinyl-CoA:acetate CoA-transferase
LVRSDRIWHPGLLAKRTTAEAAAALIEPGATVGMSGFTGAGYPKAVPLALAARIEQAHQAGRPFALRLFTGASTGPELDGALAKVNGIEFRLPYNSDPIAREKINRGEIEYLDLHLSQVAPMVRGGFLGPVDVAIIEVTAIHEDGSLVPSSSLGNNRTFLDAASAVILEVNHWQDVRLAGMHDIYYGLHNPPGCEPIPLRHPADRIGETRLRCDPAKVVAVVETQIPDRCTPFVEPGGVAQAIAGHLLDFFEHEVKKGRLPHSLLPLQSGVGNVANAVLGGLLHSRFEDLTAYTEVLQDSMLELLLSQKMHSASATALSLSPAALERFRDELDDLRERVVLRPQEISNHPEIVRRLGVIAMNGMLECDLLGNVNSTHVMGSQVQNGIGGSGDFARNAYLSIFTAPSTAKQGRISTVVPHVSHVDHVPQDVQILVSEQGLADLRGLSPRARAKVILQHCAHPDYRGALQEYFDRTQQSGRRGRTPVLLDEAFAWHQRYLRDGSMRG